MAYDQTIIERLERDLNNADAAREKLETELEYMREHATWGWSRHNTIEAIDDPLPVPRLEIEVFNASGDWYVSEWVYSMVYEHLLGHHVRVPLGHTKQTGGHGRRDSVEHLPFRDGAHIKHEAKAFGWPAFWIIEGNAQLIELGT